MYNDDKLYEGFCGRPCVCTVHGVSEKIQAGICVYLQIAAFSYSNNFLKENVK